MHSISIHFLYIFIIHDHFYRLIYSWSFFSSSIILVTSSIIYCFDLFCWYSFTSSLHTSFEVYSLSFFLFIRYFSACFSIEMIFLFVLNKAASCKYSSLFLLQFLFLLSYFLLVPLLNWMINKPFVNRLIKCREYIQRDFFEGAVFFIVREDI